MTGWWMPTEALLRLALALERFVWQGAAIGALFGAANALLSRAAPRVRYALGCAALALMLAAPVATLVGGSRGAGNDSGAIVQKEVAARTPLLPAAPAPLRKADSLAPWLVGAWLAGVAVLSVRLVAGWAALERLRRRLARPADAALAARLAALAARMRVSRPVRLLESAAIRVPGAIGALRPAILVPAGIATGFPAEQIDALLAHELAHVARGDYVVHLMQAIAETLLFFHPAVWWVSHRIRVEREHACDDLAVAATGDALLYARALLALEERRRERPRLEFEPRLALAADGAGLSGRIRRLLSMDAPAPGPAIAIAIALAGAAALGAVGRDPGSTRAAAAATPHATSEAAASAEPDVAAEPVTAPAPAATPRPARSAHPARPAPPASESAASREPTAEDLIAFRIHGVTPEYVASIRAEGFARPTPDELLALRIHGVTPEYIRGMTSVLGRQPLEEYAAFRIHGLTPEGVGELRAAFGNVSADEALAMRIHGVTPEFAREMRDAGFGKLGADDALAFRIHGVTPEFVREMRGLGFPSLGADDAVAFRIHGVTPEFVREMRGLGFPSLGADDAVAFRIHGVTAAFVKQIHDFGYPSIAADDLIAFRIHGLTPSVIRELNARAGERLSPDELIERRIHGAWEEEER